MATLEALVGCDTRNPPRAPAAGGVFAFVDGALPPGFARELVDLGDGCVWLYAWRGTPRVCFNVHLDTVPADPGWRGDPLGLVVEGERAVGLGACDIKGAAACLLTAVARVPGDVGLLFTSDEEAGSSRCIRSFLDRKLCPPRVVVAEPTACRAVLEHRGIATATGSFRGVGGHASSPRALADSALHEAVRWAARALAFAEAAEARRYRSLAGIRFNLGVLAGGQKANMIAAEAELRFGVRPLPDQDPRTLLSELGALAPDPARVAWTPAFVAPPLPHPAPGTLDRALAFAADLGLEPAEPVDFWTEAALFSAAGHDALVYGPGDIAQAHTAGEWVSLSELARAEAAYERWVGGGA
ncbi:MAG: acetylornithine deacetylase [Polyangiaceae bacterium]|nr:acetylornithine deacetylase [Polyangiaceae bacterium]